MPGATEMGGIVAAEIRVVAILLVVSLVAVIARRQRFPYTVALVLAGLGFSAQTQLGVRLVETVTVTPEVILALFLPPLLFEAALHLRLVDLRRDLALILGLAVPGLFAGTVLIAGILQAAGILAWGPALVFGAMISATDPVAVVATFRALGAPRRLTTLVESESLFNDGAAIVAFGLMVAFVGAGRFSPLEAGISLARVSLGGVGVGLALGFVAYQAIGRIDDHLVETTLTTILCYGSYLVAESLHVSGVLAVVMAGLVQGERGTGSMSPTTRVVLFSFWEYVAFLANSVLFLLIGVSVQLDALAQYIRPVLVGVVAVLVARSVVVYGVGLLLRSLRRGVPTRYLHLMVWGGLRGAVGLALALSLPVTLAERPQLLAMTFGVVLFTLLGQATTVPRVMKRLGLTTHDPARAAYERHHAQLLAARSVRRYLRRRRAQGALMAEAVEAVEEDLTAREEAAEKAIAALLAEEPDLAGRLVRVVRREALGAERAAIQALEQEGIITPAVAEDLTADVDARRDDLRSRGSSRGDDAPGGPGRRASRADGPLLRPEGDDARGGG